MFAVAIAWQPLQESAPGNSPQNLHRVCSEPDLPFQHRGLFAPDY